MDAGPSEPARTVSELEGTPMYNIALVNMPLAKLNLPSPALTQLRAVAQETFGERVVDVEAELAALFAHGLVFHEGERYLSLVVPPPTSVAVPLGRLELAAAV